MESQTLKIATRKSPLALWQANYVKHELRYHHPDLEIEIVALVTQGDKMLDAPLAKKGGKGLFVKELENALLSGQAHIAVHSMKDVPVALPLGLIIPIICRRADARDVFVSNNYQKFEDLPAGSIIGTSSLRRQSQLLALRPDLQIKNLRGNVNTRLQKLDEGEYDAIVLAAAGLQRLKMNSRIKHFFDPHQILPAVGQGAMGIECVASDTKTIELLESLHHEVTAIALTAERALNAHLNGGCQVPIAAYATIKDNQVKLSALVGNVDGSNLLQVSGTKPIEHAEQLGVELAEKLLQMGAAAILQKIYENDRD